MPQWVANWPTTCWPGGQTGAGAQQANCRWPGPGKVSPQPAETKGLFSALTAISTTPVAPGNSAWQ